MFSLSASKGNFFILLHIIDSFHHTLCYYCKLSCETWTKCYQLQWHRSMCACVHACVRACMRVCKQWQ